MPSVSARGTTARETGVLARQAVTADETAIKNRYGAAESGLLKRLLKKQLTACKQMIAKLEEAIAALAGAVPFNADSADSKGLRRIQGGRAHVRSALYMAAVSAIAHNPDMIAARRPVAIFKQILSL
jgi:hypothetical protein